MQLVFADNKKIQNQNPQMGASTTNQLDKKPELKVQSKYQTHETSEQIEI